MKAARTSSGTAGPSDDLESLAYALRRQGVSASEVILPTSAQVLLRGTRFHYLDWGGETTQRPIVFLHGRGLTAHTFDLVCLALRSDFRCLSLDQRGHGDSEWSPVLDYDYDTQAEDVAAFVDHLGLDRFVLVGMSMGGLNAIAYAGRHPRRIGALVLIDVGPEMTTAGGTRIHEFLDQPSEADSLEDFIQRALAFNPRRDPYLLRRSLLHNLRQRPDGKWAWKWDPRWRSGYDPRRMAERRKRLWKEVEQIDCPTLIVRGAESESFTEANAAELVRRLSNGRHVVVDDAGHNVHGDNPAGLIRELRTFLAGA